MLFHWKIQSSWFVWTSERDYKNSATLGRIEQETSYKVGKGLKIVAFSSPSSYIDASVAGHNPTELSTDRRRKFKDSTGSRCNLWLAKPARAIVHAKPYQRQNTNQSRLPSTWFPRLIGQRDYSDYRFTSLNCKSVYSNLLDLPLLQNAPFSLGYRYIPGHPAVLWLRGRLVLRKQWYQPVFMKKIQPLYKLWSLSDPELPTEWKRCLIVVLKRIRILFG